MAVTCYIWFMLLLEIVISKGEPPIGFHDQRTLRRLALLPINSMVGSCAESEKQADITAVPMVLPPYNPQKTSFSPWGGKRAADDNEIDDPLFSYLLYRQEQKRQFSPWGGKRSPIEPVTGSQQSGKREDFSPWGGKRFNPWGGKRNGDHDSWSAGDSMSLRKKRASDAAADDKRGSFNAWGGKRSSVQDDLEDLDAWGNKRNDFSPWGGKRSNAFNAWGGKRSNAFNAWGGKRSNAFNAWGGKRSNAFNAWGGKRSDAFNAKGSELPEDTNATRQKNSTAGTANHVMTNSPQEM